MDRKGPAIMDGKRIYSGTCAIRHLSFLTSCDIQQKLWSQSISVN